MRHVSGVPAYGDAFDWGGRERWLAGERAWFEYHCLESPRSSDAEAWYRSHRPVTVVAEEAGSGQRDPAGGCYLPSYADRCEAAMPLTYRVRWDDGFEHSAWEDELLVSPTFFERPDPPAAERR